MKISKLTAFIATVFATTVLTASHVFAQTHTVKKGETLWGLSKTYKVSVASIKSWSGLKNDTIVVGQKVIVSNKTTSQVTTNKKKVKTTSGQLNIRSGAGTNFKKIGSLKNGTEVAVKSVKGGWSYIEVGKLKGYVSNDYLVNVKNIPEKTPNKVQNSNIPKFLADGTFPLKKGTYAGFSNTWGASRTYGGARKHEGIDIPAKEGTPLYAAMDGVVTKNSWLELGGWRYSIRSGEYILYYAHMRDKGLIPVGKSVKKGQLIGYIGSTGYGPVGTKNKFGAHLHFGIYDKQSKAMNPYNYLKYWESKK